MSESELHARLVEVTLGAMNAWAPPGTLSLWADHSNREYLAPFKLGEVLPDIFGLRQDIPRTVIGEAKTHRDVDNLHTRKQLTEYFEFLLCQQNGLLWMSVPIGRGGEAIRVANSVRGLVKCDRVELIVSEWLLSKTSAFEKRWHVQ